jgi:hypothetical protein
MSTATTPTTVIHVRFAPDGNVTEIGERPAGTSAQAWFNHLCLQTGNAFEALSGGRAVFRLPAELVATMKEALSQRNGHG